MPRTVSVQHEIRTLGCEFRPQVVSRHKRDRLPSICQRATPSGSHVSLMPTASRGSRVQICVLAEPRTSLRELSEPTDCFTSTATTSAPSRRNSSPGGRTCAPVAATMISRRIRSNSTPMSVANGSGSVENHHADEVTPAALVGHRRDESEVRIPIRRSHHSSAVSSWAAMDVRGYSRRRWAQSPRI